MDDDGSLHKARNFHTETLLPNGRVLVTGGSGARRPIASTEIYDPVRGAWKETGKLITARNGTPRRCCPTGKF